MQQENTPLGSSIDHVVNDCRHLLTNEGSMLADERLKINYSSADGNLGYCLHLLRRVMGPGHT